MSIPLRLIIIIFDTWPRGGKMSNLINDSREIINKVRELELALGEFLTLYDVQVQEHTQLSVKDIYTSSLSDITVQYVLRCVL